MALGVCKLAVWMRDLLGMSDDLEGVGKYSGIGRLEVRVGEVGLGGQARRTICPGAAPLNTRYRLLS
jgi:hypothetical protein